MSLEKKQITRNRISYSCQTCRRRKVRCDKTHPVCGGCVKAGEECVYRDLDRPSIIDSNALPSDSNGIESRKRRAVEDYASSDHDQTSSLAIRALEVKLDQLSSTLEEINGVAIKFSIVSPANGDQTGTPSQLIERNTAESTTQSHSGGSQNHLVSLLRAVDKLNHLNELLRSGIQIKQDFKDRPTAVKSIDDEVPSTCGTRLYGSNSQLEKDNNHLPAALAPDSITMAPPEDESNVLFRSWLFSMHPVFPIFSPKAVLKKYEQFNHWYRLDMDKGLANPDPSFMPFLMLIWYTGFTCLSDKAKKKWSPWLSKNSALPRRLRIFLRRILDEIDDQGTPSLWALATAVISQAIGIHGQDINNCSMHSFRTVRAAQNLGLHSERSIKSLEKPDAEIRRRLWWEILTLDAAVSSTSGTPVILDEVYTDIQMISELKESMMGVKDAREYETQLQTPQRTADRPDDPLHNQTTSFVSVFHLVAKARYKLTIATKKVLKANMSAQPMTLTELKATRKFLLSTSQEVNAMLGQIPTRGIPELEFNPGNWTAVECDYMDSMGLELSEHEISCFLRESSDQQGLSGRSLHYKAATLAFHKWARITLSMMVDRLECLSYAPFLRNSKSRLWAVARNCALKACHGFLRKYLSLAQDPEIQRFRWAWNSMCQPMHATLILLVDLHDRPISEEAPRSRALIDSVLSLSTNSEIAIPLREGGHEAWKMLRKLRHKAWQKAGLDPDVLWSEDDQLAVGVGKPLNENDIFIRSFREDLIYKYNQSKYQEILSHGLPPRVEREVLHPSELGPGEPVTGPVAKDLANLDIASELPAVLLLRARRDQKPMPFPLHSEWNSNRGENEIKETIPGPELKPRINDPEVFHIGELIQKIRQSQRHKANEHANHIADPAAALPHVQTSQTNYDPRSILTTENTAYQDILDQHAEAHANATEQSMFDRPKTDVVIGSRFRYLPASSAPNFQTTKLNDHTAKYPHVVRQQIHQTPDPIESFSFPASIPPTLQNYDSTKPLSRAPLTAGQAVDTISESQPNATPRSQTRENQGPQALDESMAVENLDLGADADFDWDKWDELFGQFAAFDDGSMLDLDGTNFDEFY